MAVAITGSYKMFRDPLGWNESPSLITPRMDLGSAGDTDNALAFGGVYRCCTVSPPVQNVNVVTSQTEEWNGSSWSSQNYLNTARGAHAGFGTVNAAVAANGNICTSTSTPSLVYCTTTEVDCTEEYNGTSWSTSNPTNKCRYYGPGTGTQNAGIIAGGNEQTGITSETCVEWYDGNAWSNRPQLNLPVAGHAIVGNQDDAYLFGGACILRWLNPSTFGYSECYNSYTQALVGGFSWSSQPNLNRNRSNLSGVGTQNAALAFGGHYDLFPLSCTEEWDGTTWSNTSPYSTIYPKYLDTYGQASMASVGELGDNLNSESKILSIGGTNLNLQVPPSYSINSPSYLLISSSIETGSIAQGLIQGGSLTEREQFGSQITDSTASIYDTVYAGDIETKTDVSESLQWRNYPVQEQCIVSASFEEIFFPENDTSSVNYTIRTQFLSPCATGSVRANITTGLISAPESDDFIVIPWGGSQFDYFGIVALTASNNTTFIGWSTSPLSTTPSPLFPSYNLLSTSTLIDIRGVGVTGVFDGQDQTYYAIFDCNVEEKVYCYTTSSNKNDICLECQEEKTIFFNKTKYQTSGSEEITWYEDIDLTITASDGYYYLSGSENPIVYDLTTGSATFELVCEGEVIYCS